MTQIRNKHVLITGGAQGMGRLLADRCLQRGADRVTLWDLDAKALDTRVADYRAEDYTVTGTAVDMSDCGQITRAAVSLLAEAPVDLLINNAGVVVGKPLSEHTHEDIERTIRVNVLGVMHATRAFLPAMIARGSGHIVTMASASGYLPVPRMTVYAASKWACLGFSESLRVELRQHPGIHLTTVCPSYIKTGMFNGVAAPVGAPLLEPDYAAERIVNAIEQDKTMVRMPWLVNLMPALYAVLPAPVFDLVLGRIFGIYHSMDNFTGHQGTDSARDGDREKN